MTDKEFKSLEKLLDLGNRINIMFYVNDLVYESRRRAHKIGV